MFYFHLLALPTLEYSQQIWGGVKRTVVFSKLLLYLIVFQTPISTIAGSSIGFVSLQESSGS